MRYAGATKGGSYGQGKFFWGGDTHLYHLHKSVPVWLPQFILVVSPQDYASVNLSPTSPLPLVLPGDTQKSKSHLLMYTPCLCARKHTCFVHQIHVFSSEIMIPFCATPQRITLGDPCLVDV